MVVDSTLAKNEFLNLYFYFEVVYTSFRITHKYSYIIWIITFEQQPSEISNTLQFKIWTVSGDLSYRKLFNSKIKKQSYTKLNYREKEAYS